MTPYKIGTVGFRLNLRTEWPFPDDVELILRILRPDGELLEVAVDRVEESVAQLVTDGTEFVMPGEHRLELQADGPGFSYRSQTAVLPVEGIEDNG